MQRLGGGGRVNSCDRRGKNDYEEAGEGGDYHDFCSTSQKLRTEEEEEGEGGGGGGRRRRRRKRRRRRREEEETVK